MAGVTLRNWSSQGQMVDMVGIIMWDMERSVVIKNLEIYRQTLFLLECIGMHCPELELKAQKLSSLEPKRSGGTLIAHQL